MKFTIFSASRLILVALGIAQFNTLGHAHPSVTKRGAPIVMGLAESFGIIAGTTLTSTGATLVTGDCGTCPGTSIAGFPPGSCTGTTSAGGIAACDAVAACQSAFTNARAVTPTSALPAADLGGLTLAPGAYTFPTSAATLTGTLTLDGSSNAAGQFIFLIETTFGAMAASRVELINGAQACNVFFIVGSSASVGAAAALQGNILAYTSIAVRDGASNQGAFCALHGAVTLINDALTAQPGCYT
ncbi:FG-GAP repeat protein [Akanthomyces lecanii RCEF 1005]|uniref:FG-GAP repeat protein n=1 Tax=Akanthomyces lecanii RCEF 1005 TaxID=1081108 RepID=A0A162JZE3_CORDF|nr:FG-GAP repeat protein [Akanthomyces lecanii RCEF 1005]